MKSYDGNAKKNVHPNLQLDSVDYCHVFCDVIAEFIRAVATSTSVAMAVCKYFSVGRPTWSRRMANTCRWPTGLGIHWRRGEPCIQNITDLSSSPALTCDAVHILFSLSFYEVSNCAGQPLRVCGMTLSSKCLHYLQ